MEMEILLPVEGGWTPYGLIMAGGVLAGLILTWALFGARSLKAGVAAALGGLLGGHVVWGLVQLEFLESFVEPGWLFFLEPWLGGYALYGAVPGALLGVLLYHLYTRVKGQDSLLSLLDSLAPGACVALIMGRAAEYFNGQGIGEEVVEPALQFFPMAINTEADPDFAYWQVCVWFWEALAALGILILLLALIFLGRRRQTDRPEGRLAGIFMILLACSQIFLEQLRRDDCLKFGFVISFTQIAAAVTMAATLVIRGIRNRGVSLRDLFRLGVVAAGILTVIFAEFVFDKPQFYVPLWTALLVQGAAAALLLLWKMPRGLAWRIPLALVLPAAGVALALLLGNVEAETEALMAYGVIALTMGVTAAAALGFARGHEPVLGRRRQEASA